MDSRSRHVVSVGGKNEPHDHKFTHAMDAVTFGVNTPGTEGQTLAYKNPNRPNSHQTKRLPIQRERSSDSFSLLVRNSSPVHTMGVAGHGRRGAHMFPLLLLVLLAAGAEGKEKGAAHRLRFRRDTGTFKVVQVADMHYADGRRTGCEDVLPSQVAGCTDLNTTAFLYRVFRAENPDLVVFTGQYYMNATLS